MSKLSLKTGIIACFFAAAAFLVCSCLEQLDYEEFIEDEGVQEFAEKINERVGLFDKTDGQHLTRGSGSITGLKADRYYMVEIVNENGSQKSPREIHFVQANGTLSANTIDNPNAHLLIRRIPSNVTAIAGLYNDKYYAVYSAVITGALYSYDTNTAPSVAGGGDEVSPAINANGLITLKKPENGYYLRIPAVDASSYTVLKSDVLPSPPSNPAEHQFINSLNIIQLREKDTTTDYIFYNKDTNDDKPLKFMSVAVQGDGVLNIHLAPFTSIPPTIVEVPVTTVTVSLPNIINAQINGTALNATFTIGNTPPFTAGTVKVDYEGADITDLLSGNTLTINLAAVNNALKKSTAGKAINEIGEHIISISAQGGGKYWSAIIKIIVVNF